MSRVEFDDAELARLAELVAVRLDGRGPEPWVGVREAAAHLALQAPADLQPRLRAEDPASQGRLAHALPPLASSTAWLDGRA